MAIPVWANNFPWPRSVNKVVAKLSSLNAQHLASAEQLVSALERGKSTDQLAEMRELYEAATRRWRTESHPALMIAREVLPEDACALPDQTAHSHSTNVVSPDLPVAAARGEHLGASQ